MFSGADSARLVLALLVAAVACRRPNLVGCIGPQQGARPSIIGTSNINANSNNNNNINSNSNNNNGDNGDHSEYDNYRLESMEDLEHVAYLTMRNFNITDEGLLAQSSLLMNFGNAANHKQHQAAAIGDQRTRLALMLESFILHLRNGHLRRLQLDELEAIVATLNSTGSASSEASEAASLPRAEAPAEQSDEAPNSRKEPAAADRETDNSFQMGREFGRQQVATRHSPTGGGGSSSAGSSRAESNASAAPLASEGAGAAQRDPPAAADAEQATDKSLDRCRFLVTIFKLELKERRRKSFEQQRQQQQQQQQQSKIDYESGQQRQQVDSPPSQSQSEPQPQSLSQSQRHQLERQARQSAPSVVATAANSDSTNAGQELSETDSNEGAGGGGGGGGDDDDDQDQAIDQDDDENDNDSKRARGPDSARLMRLCQLAVRCHSADELVSLISGPWREAAGGGGFSGGSARVGQRAELDRARSTGRRRKRRWVASMLMAAAGADEAAAESGLSGPEESGQLGQQQQGALAGSKGPLERQGVRQRNLRDSLSLSLAKLCPLMLFQLHDDDGVCSVRRDDRPSMITVWAFATLFVTIVSFCSLIGLSITPLLGTTATDSSTNGSSDSSDSSPVVESRRFHHGQPHGHLHHHHRQHHHLRQAASMASTAKSLASAGAGSGAASNGNAPPASPNNGARDHRTCLTLFEGLAVGSLVGSALFSLIPQAFELQERESNQGFLLKALIIFFGIYLFFCSERIMRIILDTRQKRKKTKRITNPRSSNSIAMQSMPSVDFDHQQYQLQLQQQFADFNPNSKATNSGNSGNNKQEISTVAWMIVLGDGLHNFIDGISIGAAFSESILSGVSISVAVICEEFPHELGDFAVLVSSGMTVRQALGYNFLSACTCYLGMAVGIILGDVNDGASYISALAAGVFLYIALVDMMGELSATLEETSRDSIAKTLKLLLLQNIGIFIGISIIFILSFIDF